LEVRIKMLIKDRTTSLSVTMLLVYCTWSFFVKEKPQQEKTQPETSKHFYREFLWRLCTCSNSFWRSEQNWLKIMTERW